MKKQSILFTLLLGVFLFTACNKDEDTLTYYMEETKCGNPWRNNLPFLSDDEYKTFILQYLVDELEVVTDEIAFVASTAEDCEACNCKSGRRVQIMVEPNYEEILEENGWTWSGF